MSATTITNIEDTLKKDILPTIQNVTFKQRPLLDKIKKNKGVIKLANNTFYVTYQIGHHSGIQHVAEGATLFTGKPKFDQGSIPAKYGFGHFSINDQAIQATRNDKGALATVLERNAMALRDTFARELNRIIMGDGTGQLCLINGGATAAAQTVDTPGTDYIYEGGQLDIVGDTDVLVSSVDSTTGFTLSASITTADNEVVTRANADEPMGLKGGIDDGDFVATIQGFTRASTPFANSFTDDTAEQLSESDMITAYLNAQKYGSRKKVWFMGLTLYQRYGSILTSMKRSADTKEVLSGGWKGLDFMGGESGVILDHDTPAGIAFCVDMDELTIGEMTPMGWLEEANGGILTRVSNQAAWEGTMRYYWNVIFLSFQAHARLRQKTG